MTANQRRAYPIVVRKYQAAGRGRNGQPAEIIAGDIFARSDLSLSLDRQVALLRRVISEQAGEDRLVLPEEFKGAERENAAAQSRLAILPRTPIHPMHHMIGADPLALPAVPVQQCQGFGIGHRQRAEQDRIHEAVDRGVGADAQRQREHGQRSECAVVDHRAQPVAKILRKFFKECPGPRGACALL
jgi:hypothetical protein